MLKILVMKLLDTFFNIKPKRCHSLNCASLVVFTFKWIRLTRFIFRCYSDILSGPTMARGTKIVKQMLLHTVKWGYIEQQGNIEQSYFFHGNSLISFYNSHVASCLCFRSVTEGFCSPLEKFSKCPHNL